MNPGKLNKRVILQSFQTVKDEEGIPTQQWSNTMSLYASVEPLTGREYWLAASTESQNSLKITVRYKKGISSDMRLVYNAKNYDIKSVIDPNEAHKELVLMCVEVQNGN